MTNIRRECKGYKISTMVFSSTIFIFCFLPITLLLYYTAYALGKAKPANIVLLLASMIFYAWGGTKYFLILLAVVAVNYALTLLIESMPKYRRSIFILIMLIDIGNLLYFKYFNFFGDNARMLAALIGINIPEAASRIVLPIGISFYTFQIISYVADVYMGRTKAQKSFIKLALYVMMFPQLIAGPIVRYTDINNEMDARTISCGDIEYGIKRFIIGFFKKVFIANAAGGMADVMFSMPGDINMAYAWLGAVCYTLQIYYDFSAYSDMAIGLGRAFGFRFNENFDLPYISCSIQEFWRRWHISLSSWFRDYVYIPLGGNRRGKFRTYINLGIVFFLTGFWHGAAWQFIVWGLYHGAFLIMERLGLRRIIDRLPKILRHVYTMTVVIIGWVFFRADDLGTAIMYIKAMLSFDLGNFGMYSVLSQINALFVICLAIGIIFSFTRFEGLKRFKIWNSSLCVNIRYLTLWIISVLYLVGLSYNPFIYFKF